MGEPAWTERVITYWVSPEQREAGQFSANRDMVYLTKDKEAIFSRLDEDGDAAIEREEAKTNERLAKEFDHLDSYSNDRITRSEFSMFEPLAEQ